MVVTAYEAIQSDTIDSQIYPDRIALMSKPRILSIVARGWGGLCVVDGRNLERITIEIPQSFRSFVEGALLRVQAQYPSLGFSVSSEGIEIASLPPDHLDKVRKSILHTVYREKIYVETLPLRQALINAVTAK